MAGSFGNFVRGGRGTRSGDGLGKALVEEDGELWPAAGSVDTILS